MDGLTLEAAVGQLILAALPGTDLDAGTEAMLRAGRAGGVCLFSRNVRSVAQLRELVTALRAAAPRPLLVSADLEGGYVWRLVPPATHPPSAMACGAARRPDLTRALARAVGTEMRALGIDLNLAPVVDVNNNAANPVIATRSFGESPGLVTEHAVAAVEGYHDAGVAACAKHFPGHGDTAVDSHLALPSIRHDLARLRNVELAPFAAAVAAGVDAVMTAHVVFPALDADLPATLSPRVLRGLLREELGFTGVVFSDAMGMSAVADRWGTVEACVLTVIAGADVVCSTGGPAEAADIHAALMAAIDTGRLTEAQVRESAERGLRLKLRLSETVQPDLDVVGCDEHVQVADELAAAAVTRAPQPPGEVRPGILPLGPESRVLVVEVYSGPRTGAEDALGMRGQLAATVRRHAAQTQELRLHLGQLEERLGDARRAAAAAEVVVLATRNAWRSEAQRALVAAVGQAAPRCVLVALRDPHDLRLLPVGGEGLAAYCDVSAAVRAVTACLFGAPAPGTLPVTI